MRTRPSAALRLERLEAREVPAVLIQIDYSRDLNGFFNNAEARATLERAAADLGSTLNANLAAISPGGGNTWTATFFDPATGGQFSVPNLTVGANTLRLYVGGRDLPGTTAGYGGYGGYSMSGSQTWINTVRTRGHSGFATWGGSVTFDTTQSWHFGTTTAGLDSNELDFYSVAVHELGHVLGIGTADQWYALRSGGTFRGANAMAAYGGAVPLTADGAHWADGVTVGGQTVSLDPILSRGTRVSFTSLDTAALRDLGWGAAAPGSPPVSPPVARVPVASAPPVWLGGGDGFVTAYTASGGTLVPTGFRFAPFAGYTGPVRVATGDFDGDGTQDVAAATAAGPVSLVRVVSGHGFDLVGPTVVAGGYTKGLQLAAGDVTGDGRSELVLATGEGFAPLVGVFAVGGGGIRALALFVAFDAPGFGGGIRVAAGDLNRDGYDDVVVTSASQVGAVTAYSGAALRFGRAEYMLPISVPAGGLAVGLNPAVGDLDGDGFDDLALTFERGGPALVAAWSGAVLARAPGVPLTGLPLMALYQAVPGNASMGARLAIRDVDGNGRGELIAVSSDPLAPLASVTTLAQAQTGTGGPAVGTVTPGSNEGTYAGARFAPADDDGPRVSATRDPRLGLCQCGGCLALAELAARADGDDALLAPPVGA